MTIEQIYPLGGYVLVHLETDETWNLYDEEGPELAVFPSHDDALAFLDRRLRDSAGEPVTVEFYKVKWLGPAALAEQQASLERAA